MTYNLDKSLKRTCLSEAMNLEQQTNSTCNNRNTHRRVSDSKAIVKPQRYIQSIARLSLPTRLETLPKPSGDIWTGPEELIEGRLIAKEDGFLPTNQYLRLITQPSKRNNRWQRQKLNVINAESGTPFAGGARVKMHSDGFDLLDKSNRVLVKCYEEVDKKLHQLSIIICSTESLSNSDVPISKKPVFYKWFKASLDPKSCEVSLELWSGSQYYPLWYTDSIRKGEDVSIKTVAEDDMIGKLCCTGVMLHPGIDPALMICLSVAFQRLTADPVSTHTKSL